MASDDSYAELGSLEREPADLNVETMPAQESNLPSDVLRWSAESNSSREPVPEGGENPSMWRGALRSLGGIGIDRPSNERGLRASQGRSL